LDALRSCGRLEPSFNEGFPVSVFGSVGTGDDDVECLPKLALRVSVQNQ
jgi:hypothetical protein